MMEWAELDLDAALWTIPSMKMKRVKVDKEQGAAHVVPLPTLAVELLRGIHTLTGHGRYVFPGERSHDRPLSDNSVRSALYSLGFGKEQSWHGFRASARTMLVDELNLDYNVIEANLAHAVKDANGTRWTCRTGSTSTPKPIEQGNTKLQRLSRLRAYEMPHSPDCWRIKTACYPDSWGVSRNTIYYRGI